MSLTLDIVMYLCIGIFFGSLFGYIAKSYLLLSSGTMNAPVEINSDLSVSDVIDHYGRTSRPPSYQSNEEERPLSPDSAEDPPPYRSNEILDVEMIEMRPIPPSK